MPVVSVVVPVYRSERTLGALYNRLSDVLNATAEEWEIILVNDASPDNSWAEMRLLRAGDARVKIIRLAHNHGQQHATLCGLGYAQGKYIITIDDDLQFHPEDIPKFLDKLKSGVHVVFGRKQGSNHQTWWRHVGSALNDYVAGIVLTKPRTLSLSSYRAFSRKAVDQIVAYKGAHAHISALALRSTPHEHIANVAICHSPRADKQDSSYSVSKLIKTASYLLINHSYIPLRFMIGWGLVVSMASILFGVWALVFTVLHGRQIAGWASLAVLVSFLSGNILLALGVIGEYVGRLVEESARQRQFAIFEEDT
jgi:undecaprenyl-phosphate 4-deoxy-4-formamido-L-arabinose transferase